MSTYSSAVLADSPLLFYKLDDTSLVAVDSGSLGVNAAYTNTAPQRWVQKERPLTPEYQVPPAYSVLFNPDGTSTGYASTGALPGFPTTAVTLEVWASLDRSQTSNTPGLVTYNSTKDMALYVQNGTLYVNILNNTVNTGVQVLDNKLRYYALTWESVTGNYVVYVNSEIVASGSLNIGITIPTNGTLGVAVYTSASTGAKGRFANVAVYGAVLTPTQIHNHWTSVDKRGQALPAVVSFVGTKSASTRLSTAFDRKTFATLPVGSGVFVTPPTPVVAIQSITAVSSTLLRVAFTLPVIRQPALEVPGNYMISPTLAVHSAAAENIASPTYVDLTVDEMLDAQGYTLTVYNALEAA